TASLLHVHVHGRIFGLRMICAVDYGQRRKYLQKRSTVRQRGGKKQVFNSEADIINYFENRGWRYVEYDSYAFVFRKRLHSSQH
ncbi:MAG: hypothetical protein ACE5DN_00900, partial [Flavobacteriales bacterium]